MEALVFRMAQRVCGFGFASTDFNLFSTWEPWSGASGLLWEALQGSRVVTAVCGLQA